MHYRRIRGDMIETYKILSGKYDLAAIPNLITLSTLTTRGNDLRLQKNRARYNLCIFLQIELSICGTVQSVHAESTNTLKSRLDKFWKSGKSGNNL